MNKQEKEFMEKILKQFFGDDYAQKISIIDDKRTVYINVLNQDNLK